MATAFAKIAASFPRNPSLGFGHRLNDNLRLMEEFVETPAGDGIKRLASMMTAASTKFAADVRRTKPFSIARAQASASGSLRRIAISADVSTNIWAVRVRHKVVPHDLRSGTAL